MNKRSLIAAAVAAVIILGLAVWAMNYNGRDIDTNTPNNTQTTETETQTQTETQQTDTEEQQLVAYSDEGFAQQRYTFKAGETVTVRNDSSRSLEFASDEHPTHRDNTELNLEPIEPGGQATLTVTKAGTWGAHNHLREEHMTTLVVTE